MGIQLLMLSDECKYLYLYIVITYMHVVHFNVFWLESDSNIFSFYANLVFIIIHLCAYDYTVQ